MTGEARDRRAGLGLSLAFWVGPILIASAYRSGPPPGYSGGAGDQSCHYCHYEFEPGSPGGDLEVMGFPERFEAEATYELDVVLRFEGMRAAGFQLAIRHDSDEAATSAGMLEPTDGRTAVVTDEKRNVAYAQHVTEGTVLDKDGEARWRLRWKAPPAGAGPLVLNVAANAADGDESQMGDRVYTSTLRSRPVTARLP